MSSTIGITGGIGSGKSVVSRILRCNGFDVYDCDSRARNLMESDKELRNELIAKLGNSLYKEDGHLNRTYLAGVLFSDFKVREFVNSIVHSAVRKDIKKIAENKRGLFFIETAIPATGGIDRLCSLIWEIISPEYLRIKRVESRDQLKPDEIKKRIEAQKNELDRMKVKEIIKIENDDRHPLLLKVLKLTERIDNHISFTLPC